MAIVVIHTKSLRVVMRQEYRLPLRMLFFKALRLYVKRNLDERNR